ncbi:MAG: ATP-binding protein, partial [Marinilabiliaceae bacterium]|nr:ATP-binding protein [Marinilabiliaceae bacterium]
CSYYYKNNELTHSYSNKSIVYTITDSGNGFDYNNIPDPTAPENVDKVCGRGIYLMKLLSDKIEFSNEGRVVSLTFNL